MTLGNLASAYDALIRRLTEFKPIDSESGETIVGFCLAEIVATHVAIEELRASSRPLPRNGAS